MTSLFELAQRTEAEASSGSVEKGDVSVTWGPDAIVIANAEHELFKARAGDRVALQLSCSTRLVAPHWLKSVFGARPGQEHLAHVELRSSQAR